MNSELRDQLERSHFAYKEVEPRMIRVEELRKELKSCTEAKETAEKSIKPLAYMTGLFVFTNILIVIISSEINVICMILLLIFGGCLLWSYYAIKNGEKVIPRDTPVLEEVENALLNILEERKADMEFIPQGYQYTQATEYLLDVVSAGRADSLKEALAMYDEQLHRWKMEESQMAIIEQQRKMASSLNQLNVQVRAMRYKK